MVQKFLVDRFGLVEMLFLFVLIMVVNMFYYFFTLFFQLQNFPSHQFFYIIFPLEIFFLISIFTSILATYMFFNMYSFRPFLKFMLFIFSIFQLGIFFLTLISYTPIRTYITPISRLKILFWYQFTVSYYVFRTIRITVAVLHHPEKKNIKTITYILRNTMRKSQLFDES